jgi:hypothetical protein
MNHAKPTDWDIKPFPIKRTTIHLGKAFSPDEMGIIRRGLVPLEMEDKWFIYWADNTLYFHRSWTGFCVYVVRFAEDADGCRIVEADANRDPEQYNETSDERDAEMICYLIDVLLLNRKADYPNDEPNPELRAIKHWTNAGRAMFGHAAANNMNGPSS